MICTCPLRFLSTPSGWRATIRSRSVFVKCLFLSTPSGWRATLTLRRPASTPKDFYPRPPGGGRHFEHVQEVKTLCISIHALRVEGDLRSRLPERLRPGISIHALRVEGDFSRFSHEYIRSNFYPRPPGGGRQQKRTKFSSVFAKTGEEFASLRRGKRKICRWRFKKDKFWVLIWCEGSRKSVCALASHCG